jgi:hypothetical protein
MLRSAGVGPSFRVAARVRVPGVGRPPRVARVGPRVRVAGFVLVAVALAAACGATPSAAPSASAAAAGASSIPTATTPNATRTPRSSGPPGASATPRSSGATATAASFWAAVNRGIAASKHLEVTVAGPNPGLLRYEAMASATIVDGKIGFVCLGGAAFDGQSGFARVPGTWECGAAALVSGFRRIGQPADSWNADSPRDASIREAVTAGAGDTLTWTYSGISPFLGKVTARVTIDRVSGRVVAARRTDPTGTTTYTFDYAATFPVLAVPKP